MALILRVLGWHRREPLDVRPLVCETLLAEGWHPDDVLEAVYLDG